MIQYESGLDKERFVQNYIQLELELVNGISTITKDKLVEAGIDTLKKLMNSSIEDLTEINGIGESYAKKVIKNTGRVLKHQKMRRKEKNEDTQKIITIFKQFSE